MRDRHVGEARRLGQSLGEISGRWMDLGTGGGIPGLVLACLHPQAEWVLVDATQKKASEVQRFAVELDVACRVVTGRAEDLAWQPELREGFNGVVARGVATLRVLVELARGFLVEGGRLIAVKGASAEQEMGAARGALDRTSMEVESVGWLSPETQLVTVRAVGGAPEGVPRRPGVPQRRPW